MKKFFNQNYIAFTLAEMTMVLLIMSIIGAATMPIITKNIQTQNAETAIISEPAQLWQDTGIGIYHIPSGSTGVVSFGLRPGGSADNYFSPAMAVQSLYDANINTFSQIGIGPNGKTGIGMDLYDNIKMGTNVTACGRRSVTLGSNSVIYCSSTYDANDAISFGGNSIRNASIQTNSINLGYSNSYQSSLQKELIVLGSYNSSNAGGFENSLIVGYYSANHTRVTKMLNSVVIGNYSNLNSNVGASSVSIGHYSSYSSSISAYSNGGAVNLGHYAGYNRNYDVNDVVNIGYLTSGSGSSINIGYNAGNSKINGEYDIYIGRHAGFDKKSNLDVFNAIGSYAATRNNANLDQLIGLCVGEFACSSLQNDENSPSLVTAIGHHVGYGAFLPKTATYIGRNAGSYSNLQLPSILLGAYAGYNSNTTGALVGIGYGACSNIKTNGSKMCIGSYFNPFKTPVSIYDGGYAKPWDVTSVSTNYSQVLISTSDAISDWHKTAITLYATKVFVPQNGYKTFTVPSDKRLKENIKLSKHSLNDIRKINVKDFNMKDDSKKREKIGVIAQEYMKIFPKDVVKNPSTGYYAVNIDWLLYTMVNAIKELDTNTQALTNEFKKYIKDFAGLKTKVQDLERQANAIEAENKALRNHLNKINKKLK